MSMTLTEKAAYLKGLLEGMENKDKVTEQIADILRDMALEIDGLNDAVDELGEAVMSLDDEVSDLRDLQGGRDVCCGGDGDDDDGFGDGEFDDEDYYELTCPTCGETFRIDDSVRRQGSVKCPGCDEELEFDPDELDDEEEEDGFYEDDLDEDEDED